MRVGCPSCGAEISLDALLTNEAARQSIARLAEISLPFGALTVRYIALFRPAKRRLSIERMVALIDELLPDVQRQAINRRGRDWDAPIEAWRAGMETVLAARDKGTLTTPLTSHGYLYEVLMGLAEKIEARQEADQEAARRNHRQAGAQAEGVLVGDLAAQAVMAPVAAAPRPTGPLKPSRTVLEMRAKLKKPPTGDSP